MTGQKQPFDEFMAEGQAWLDYGLGGKEGLRQWISRAARELRQRDEELERLRAENASLQERILEWEAVSGEPV